MKAIQALIDLIKTIAEKRATTTTQISLAWLLAQKPWIVHIPGTTKMERLSESNKASSIVLNNDELQEIETSLTQIKIVGERYPEASLKITGR